MRALGRMRQSTNVTSPGETLNEYLLALFGYLPALAVSGNPAVYGRFSSRHSHEERWQGPTCHKGRFRAFQPKCANHAAKPRVLPFLVDT
jgi:hypothetical protein